MTRFTFEGLRTSLEPEWVVAHDARLSRFRDKLVAGGVDPVRAQGLVEGLVVGAFSTFGGEYLEGMRADVDAIVRIRRELQGRYNRVLKLPVGSSALPKNLQPEALARIESQLETHLENIDGHTPTRAASDARPITIEEAIARYEGDDASGTPLGNEPPTDFPDEGEGTPQDEPIDRAGDPSVVAHVQQRALAFERALNRRAGIHPRARARWRVEVRRVPARPWGVAQTRELARLDPDFAGNGYELLLTPPGAAGARLPRANPRAPLEPVLGDYQFAPDGVRLIGDDHFEFLEWKHREDNPYFNFLDRPENFEKLKADMRKDLRNLDELRQVGCVGFVWGTDSADIYHAFVRAADEMGLRGITFLPVAE
jgi:hypothetical protein